MRSEKLVFSPASASFKTNYTRNTTIHTQISIIRVSTYTKLLREQTIEKQTININITLYISNEMKFHTNVMIILPLVILFVHVFIICMFTSVTISWSSV